MKDLTLPNTFLIGAQKAATTSVYSWLAQHPEICAPMAVKDYAFFTRDEFYAKGFSHLSSFYSDETNNEKIVLQGSVHYIFFEKALKRIQEFNPNSKFILIVRNPIERAISAYQYALKFNYENLPIKEAFAKEGERLKDSDVRTLSELTYMHHGLYYKQIKTFLKYFKEEQLKVVLYDDVSENSNQVVKELFTFLNIDQDFVPEFKSLNNTGDIKNKTFQKIVFGNGALRNFLVKKVFKSIISDALKAKLRWKIIHLNTKEKQSTYLDAIDEDLKNELISFFKQDIEQLENYLSKDLSSWKI